MDASGAIDSFLGRITTVLVNEAQLLGRVRGDVEFIRDEMESMNGLILHLTEAQHRNHQVRAWMKQVIGLTRDCEGNVELYIRRVGTPLDPGTDPDNIGKCLLWYFRRLAGMVRTIPVRHRVATRIKELRVRARDIADRRLRYGVTVPDSAMIGSNSITQADEDSGSPVGVGVKEEEDCQRRALLLDCACAAKAQDKAEVVSKSIDLVIKRLSKELAPQPSQSAGASRGGYTILAIVGDLWNRWHDELYCYPMVTGNTSTKVARGVYRHSAFNNSFECKAWINLEHKGSSDRETLAQILDELTGLREHRLECFNTEALATKLQEHLKGKRFLIVLKNKVDESGRLKELTKLLKSALPQGHDCTPGSAAILTGYFSRSPDDYLTNQYEIIMVKNSILDFIEKTEKLANFNYCQRGDVTHIVCMLYPDVFCIKLLLTLLYVNPNKTCVQLRKYIRAIEECQEQGKSIRKQMLMFCYNELPNKYKNCLLYLTVFPSGQNLTSTRLARRWIAEGLITSTSDGTENTETADDGSKPWATTSMDEAERYLDVLVTRGFVCPVEISDAGDMKSCTVHHSVHQFITSIARDVCFMNTDLPRHLACRLSIKNTTGLQASNYNDIIDFLPSLAASSQWPLLTMLDLEGCKGLEKHHLKSICQILLLKYLSLRNTDIVGLPKEIQKLQCLETLDIRQTMVRALAKKPIVFPLLKHFLAGHKVCANKGANNISEESFRTVCMNFCLEKMRSMEMLSHVQVSNINSELCGLSKQRRLRKLGVALRGKNAKLSDLFYQIQQLHRSLRSLSVRLDQPADSVNHGDLSPPKFIESLNIGGLTSGIPHLLQQLHHLAKLTLTEAHLKEDALRILGKLPGLSCLRLLHKSYIQSELSFKEEEFQTLKFLLVGTSDVTNITFAIGAAPKLERIIWSFPTTASISGLRHLPELREFELNGDCNPDEVRGEIEVHWNGPVFKHNPNV